jgi:hypothetical protein
LKFYAVVRYDRFGNPSKFFNLKTLFWDKVLTVECLLANKEHAEAAAKQQDGDVDIYNLEREMPKVQQSDDIPTVYRNAKHPYGLC